MTDNAMKPTIPVFLSLNAGYVKQPISNSAAQPPLKAGASFTAPDFFSG
jgi:hypothetical protein